MQVWPYEPSVLSSRSIYPDASALVGGEHAGLLLQLAGNVLSVSRLLPAGKLVHLGRYRSGLRVGFQAVGDGRGGAILVSAHGPKRVVF